MTDRKKAVVILGVLLSIAGFVLFLGNLTGCGPHRFEDRGDYAWRDHGHRHPRFWSKGFKDRVVEHLDEKMEELNLSETQKEKYVAVREKIMTNLVQGMESRKQFFNDLRSEMDKESPDMHAVADLMKDRFRRFPGFMDENLDLFMEFWDALDNDQQAKVIEKIRTKMDRRHHHPFA